jgi:protein-disulfide isomerase
LVCLVTLVARRPEAVQSKGERRAVVSGEPVLRISLDNVALEGQLAAGVGVVEYSDFQCPYCARFAGETLPRIVREYVNPGKIFFAFKHFPLDRIHAHAVRAASAAECARRLGKFREVHDFLFSHSGDLGSIDLLSVGVRARLDIREFESCLDREGRDAVKRDVAGARTLGITGTPTFLLGKLRDGNSFEVIRTESGAIPYDAFAALLDEILAR